MSGEAKIDSKCAPVCECEHARCYLLASLSYTGIYAPEKSATSSTQSPADTLPLPLSPLHPPSLSQELSPWLPACLPAEIHLFSSAQARQRQRGKLAGEQTEYSPSKQEPREVAFSFVLQPASGDRQEVSRVELSGDDDEGVVDGGAAADGDGPLRRAAGLVRAAAARLDGGREQAVRAGAGRARPAPPGLGQGGARHRQDGRRGHGPLQEPRARRPPDRVRHGALPRLRPRRGRRGRWSGGRLHPAVGRQRGARWGRGLPARVPVRRLRRRAAPRRPHAGAGEEEGGAVDRGRAQVVPLRPEEVRQGGLEEHFTQLRSDEDADAGGQPRAEVLHQAQLRGRQGQEEVEHPRHHHGAPDRRPAPLAVPVIHDHPVQRTGSELSNRAVLAATRHQAARRSECAIQFAEPDAGDAELRHGFARSRPAVRSST